MKLKKNLLKFFVIPVLFALQSARADFVDTVRDKAGLYTLKYAKVGGVAMGGALALGSLYSTWDQWDHYRRHAEEELWGPKGKHFTRFLVSSAFTAITAYATYKLYHFDVHNFHSGAVG